MKVIDFKSQESVTEAIEEAAALFGPWDLPAEGKQMSETMRLHNPGQHVVVFRTTSLKEAKMIEAVINAASSIPREAE